MQRPPFRGSAPAKIDDRGRLKIPSCFKAAFDEAPSIFVTRLEESAVLIYPMETFENEIEGNLDSRAGLNREPTRILRRLNASGMAGQVDGQGRITLSLDLRERMGLAAGTAVRVIGMKNYLEVWSEAAYADYQDREAKENRDGI